MKKKKKKKFPFPFLLIRYETQRWALNFSLETIIQQNLFNFLKLRLIKLFNQIHNNIIKTWQVFCDLWWVFVC